MRNRVPTAFASLAIVFGAVLSACGGSGHTVPPSGSGTAQQIGRHVRLTSSAESTPTPYCVGTDYPTDPALDGGSYTCYLSAGESITVPGLLDTADNIGTCVSETAPFIYNLAPEPNGISFTLQDVHAPPCPGVITANIVIQVSPSGISGGDPNRFAFNTFLATTLTFPSSDPYSGPIVFTSMGTGLSVVVVGSSPSPVPSPTSSGCSGGSGGGGGGVTGTSVMRRNGANSSRIRQGGASSDTCP